ncbi:hypothetical protein [Deinococcus hopiensis]|uniref:Uncharacterized protein n=1 Tax=Deinococcus hopiensis KR-140 TaxID=695939 RepID=A0A1W1UAZ7_9DEIO|nr:hypothetical protein [Deinococcus hopiensis]SMB77944.1 hypothetical protein SAMN00790413_04020 [Deinococcus hopiensis KR-140]
MTNDPKLASPDLSLSLPPYEAPRLSVLGAWEAVTLAQSVSLTGLGLPNPIKSSAGTW